MAVFAMHLTVWTCIKSESLLESFAFNLELPHEYLLY